MGERGEAARLVAVGRKETVELAGCRRDET
jgi:hypothetical protein